MLNYMPHLFNLFIFIMMWTLFEESVNSCDSSNIEAFLYLASQFFHHFAS